jgi:hypothetical protein
VHVPTAASCSCPSPACPAPFSCLQPPRKYLHFARHECTQIFAGRVQPSSPTLSYGYPHLGTLCRRVQLRPALSTCASLRAPSTPRPPPRPPPTPPSPPPPHTARHTYTRTHKYSQCTCVCRACTYSRVLQLPYACLSCTLRVRTAASQLPPPSAQHDCTQMFAGHVKPPSYSTTSSGYPRLSTLCRRLQLHPALTTRASLQAPSTPRPPLRPPPHPHPPTPHTPRHTYRQKLTVYLRLPYVCLQPRPASVLRLPVRSPSRACSRLANTSTLRERRGIREGKAS